MIKNNARDTAYVIIAQLYDRPAEHWFQYRYEVLNKDPMTLDEMDGDVALAYAKGMHVIKYGGFFLSKSRFICNYAKFYSTDYEDAGLNC
jgi:hypothetical protein